MNKNINKIITMLGAVAISITYVNAAITTIPDWTAPKAGPEGEESQIHAFTEVSTGSIYISGKMDFTTVDPDKGAASAFILRSNSSNLRQLIGINSEGHNFEIRTYVGPTNLPLNGLTTPPTDGATVDFIFKMDYDTSNAFFWLSPDRNKLENDQQTATLTTNFNPLNTGSIGSIQFATGSTDITKNTGVTAFSNFKVYSGNDSPFALVPETETYALIFGGLSLGFVLLRRRMKA